MIVLGCIIDDRRGLQHDTHIRYYLWSVLVTMHSLGVSQEKAISCLDLIGRFLSRRPYRGQSLPARSLKKGNCLFTLLVAM